MAKYTNEEISKVIKSIDASYVFVGEYVNNSTPLLIKHIECGNVINRNLGNFKKSQKCPYCQGGRNSWNTEKVRSFIHNQTDGEYQLISEYKNYKDYIDIKHNQCGTLYKVTFDAFKTGNRCPKCGREKITKRQLKSQHTFEKEISDLTGGDFSVVSEYMGAFKKIKLYHKKCDKVIVKVPHNFLRKPSCPNCGGFSAWNSDEYAKYISTITDDEYQVVGDYISDKKGKTTFIHNDCGREFKMLASNFTSGEQRCPHCKTNISKAEKKIRTILEKYKVDFIEQYRFSDCVDKSVLPFDFAIIEEGNVAGLIEYDGIQHFRGWGNSRLDLKNIQRRDKIKDKYCKNNNIPLFRINYKEYSELELKVKEAITWIQQQNTQRVSSLEKF